MLTHCSRLALTGLLLLTIAGCSSRSIDPGAPGADTAAARVPGEPLSRADALAQLDALAVPRGADPVIFASLKEALRSSLAAGPERFASKAPTGTPNRVFDLTTGIDDNGVEGIQWNYRNVGDYDLNGEVNISDITPIGVHFQKTPDAPDWEEVAQFVDGDFNGEVNIADITPIGQNFLTIVDHYLVEGANLAEGPFSPLGEEAFGDGSVLPSGMRIFHFVPPTAHEFYRVTPIDALGNPGIPSELSVEFLISPKTEIVGAPGGPTFNSRVANTVQLTLPSAEPTTILPGDVLVGAEDGGYLMRVVEVNQTGDQAEVVGEPGILTDVFLQGGLAEGLDNSEGGIPDGILDMNLDGQILHDGDTLGDGLFVSITSGQLNYTPSADVAVNYNRFGGVTYLRGLAGGEELVFNMDLSVIADDWDGVFPPTAAETPLWEHKFFDISFDFTAYQNGVPVTMAMQYTIYLGVEGHGALHGDYQASMNTTYTDLLLGGIYSNGQIVEVNEFTPVPGTSPEPDIPFGTSPSFRLRAYARPEIHIKLYGNPVAGNSEDLALKFQPYLQLDNVRMETPDPGNDYTLAGGMYTNYLMSLNHIGMESEVQTNTFFDTPSELYHVFVDDIIPPG